MSLTTAERVIDIIADQMCVDRSEIKPETRFVEDLNADSLDQVELVMELEEEFDTQIDDDEAAKLTTVGSVITYLENL